MFAFVLGVQPVAELVDLAGVYQRSWAVVDFALFLALFTGVATATVGRKLEGRGGQMVSIAIGGILAIASVAYESVAGTNISSLGGLAITVLLLIVGSMVFVTVRTLGAAISTSVASSVLLLGAGGTLVSNNGPASGALALAPIGAFVAAGFLLYRGIRILAPDPSGDSGMARIASRIRKKGAEQTGRSPGTEALTAPALSKEKRFISKEMLPKTRKERKRCSEIIKELKVIDRILARGTIGARERKRIAAAFEAVPPKRHDLAVVFDRVLRADQALLRFDIHAFADLGRRVAGMGQSERNRLKRLVLEERRKIGIEKRIGRIERFVKVYEKNVGKSMRIAGELLLKGNVNDCRRWIAAAIRYEEEAEREVERVFAVERMLKRLTRLELRQTRKAA